jgi:hypothetical protein
MPIQPMPPNSQGGAPSPDQNRDPFAEFVNQNSYVPVWLHPDVAHGVIRHFGRDGQAIVHPHPSSGYVAGGVVPPSAVPPVGLPMSPAGSSNAASPVGAPPPVATRPPAGAVAPLAGLPPQPAGQSIFGGGQVGQGGPNQIKPVFAQGGGILDGRQGTGKVPGKKVPATQKEGHDTVHAMLDPGELVANDKQLRGIQVKPGKGHLLRSDQKKAIKEAGKRNAKRK